MNFFNSLKTQYLLSKTGVRRARKLYSTHKTTTKIYVGELAIHTILLFRFSLFTDELKILRVIWQSLSITKTFNGYKHLQNFEENGFVKILTSPYCLSKSVCIRTIQLYVKYITSIQIDREDSSNTFLILWSSLITEGE